MLTRDRATEADGLIEDLLEGHVNPVHFAGIPLIGEEGRMEITVPHVTKGANAEPVLLGHLIDEADHPSQLAAGHGGVFQNGGRRHPGQRAEGRSTRAGQCIGLGFRSRLANF